MASFKPLMAFPPPIPTIPFVLPGLPSPIFPSLSIPNLELTVAAIELQAFQIQTTMTAMVMPLFTVVGGSLSSFLPTIPGLGSLTLIDLMAGGESALAAVKLAIQNGISLPGIPTPFYSTLISPEIQAVQTLQMITSNYMALIATSIAGLINSVISSLESATPGLTIPGLPTIPTIPTPAAVVAAIIAAVPGASTLQDVVARLGGGLNLSSLLSGLSFPGLPPLPTLPPMPNINSPDIDLMVGMTTLGTNLMIGLLKIIMNFIDSTLKTYLGFTFGPPICITI
jgi:hypothetical protein